MSENIRSLPLVHVNELLENFQNTRELGDFLKAFNIAVENRLGRSQFLLQLQQYVVSTPPTLDDLQKLVEWAEKFKFEKDEPAPPPPERTDSREFNALSELASELGHTVFLGDQFAEDHQYWFFRPAWPVQSAFWSNLFDEHDPAITIARYARLSFKSEINSQNSLPKEIRLNNEDISIISQLVDHFVNALQDHKGIDGAYLRATVLGGIGIEQILDNTAVHQQFPFEGALRSTAQFGGLPRWVAPGILQFWIRSIDATYGSDLSELDPPSKELLTNQAKFFGAILIKYVSEDGGVEDDIPKLNYVSDLLFTRVLHTISWLLAEFYTPDLQNLFNSIMGATDRARTRKFGGQLPFSFGEASGLYGDANLQTWLSQIASYKSDYYDAYTDRFSTIKYLSSASEMKAKDKRENQFAVYRYREYRCALDEMLTDGLHELACAWWSFFIASQAIIFSGLAVPPEILQEILRVAQEFKENESIIRALRFISNIMPADDQDVVALATKAALRQVSREIDVSAASTNVLQLGRSVGEVQAFLEKTIGPEAWASLSVYSQKDLIEAEQLWSRSHLEFGAKREDWGSLVTLSSRPVEAEIRDQLKEMLDAIERETGRGINERTLGGCVTAIRTAHKKKDCVSPVLVSCVSLLGRFLGEHSFIEMVRNLSDHADRKRLVSEADLLAWRMMMYKHGIFGIVGKAARAFKATDSAGH